MASTTYRVVKNYIAPLQDKTRNSPISGHDVRTRSFGPNSLRQPTPKRPETDPWFPPKNQGLFARLFRPLVVGGSAARLTVCGHRGP
jgi:hypothetical protein